MKLLSIFLCFLCISTFIPASLSEQCHPEDKKVLLKIKKAWGNPHLLAKWDPNTDCCDWFYISCHPQTHRVTTLTLFSDHRLTGPIPAEVGDLTYLDSLLLKRLPNLNGTIPSSIAKLKNLKTLQLSSTGLSGPIPEFLSQLKNLTYLYLSSNSLSGSIPSSLSKLTNLLDLQLDGNKLTGSIPESFGNFHSSSMSLFLFHNKLSGTIPASFANSDFGVVDLSRNMLQGDASMIFGSKKMTVGIDISRNRFEFDLSKVQFPEYLISLNLNHNKIYGSIPARMIRLRLLESLNVSYNRLCGQIPVGGKLQSFNYSTYFHNRCLCGAPLESCKKVADHA